MGVVLFLVPGIMAQKSVSVELGIFHYAGNAVQPLKSHDRIYAGDNIRIIVKPVSDVYAYIVHSDGSKAQLLRSGDGNDYHYSGEFKLPPEGFYTIDGQSDFEYFTFIISSKRIEVFEDLFAGGKGISHFRWNQIDLLLSALHKNVINSIPEKPMSMAGNTRDGGDIRYEFRTFVGDNIILKHYVLEVKR